MKTKESTPINGLLSADEWQDLYQQAEEWQSNLAFHKDELRFFKHIIDKYFILLIGDANLDELRKITVDITHKEKEVHKLIADFKTIYKDIGEYIDLKSNYNEEILLDEYNSLNMDCKEFETSFKELKTRVFKITEHMLESEKLKHLLKA